MNQRKKHAFATMTMAVGSAIVFGGVLAMNLFSEPPDKGTLERIAEFNV